MIQWLQLQSMQRQFQEKKQNAAALFQTWCTSWKQSKIEDTELKLGWNSVLLNMETWHNIQDHHLKEYMTLDQYLLRQIFGAHSKVPVEFVCFKSSTITNDFVPRSCWLNYLHIILNRSHNGLTKQIYAAAQKIFHRTKIRPKNI